jgi:hypothetical protein
VAPKMFSFGFLRLVGGLAIASSIAALTFSCKVSTVSSSVGCIAGRKRILRSQEFTWRLLTQLHQRVV